MKGNALTAVSYARIGQLGSAACQRTTNPSRHALTSRVVETATFAGLAGGPTVEAKRTAR
jgi:hypothetical protein